MLFKINSIDAFDSLILEKISKILTWLRVTTDQHRFGGTEFRIGNVANFFVLELGIEQYE